MDDPQELIDLAEQKIKQSNPGPIVIREINGYILTLKAKTLQKNLRQRVLALQTKIARLKQVPLQENETQQPLVLKTQGEEHLKQMNRIIRQININLQRADNTANNVNSQIDNQIQQLDRMKAKQQGMKLQLERIERTFVKFLRQVQGERCLLVLMGILGVGMIVLLILVIFF